MMTFMNIIGIIRMRTKNESKSSLQRFLSIERLQNCTIEQLRFQYMKIMHGKKMIAFPR